MNPNCRGKEMCACSMCTAGTMVGMKSSNSNSSVRCYLLECHKEWYFFLSLPLAHLRIHFHFYFKQKVSLLVKWGLNPPSYHQNSPKGAHVVEIYSHQGDLMKQEMKCVRFMSDYREQSPTTWGSKPDPEHSSSHSGFQFSSVSK